MTPRRLVSIPCALLGILLLAVPMLAVEKGNTTDIVRVTVDSSVLTVEPEQELDNGRIRLLSPDGSATSRVASARSRSKIWPERSRTFPSTAAGPMRSWAPLR